MFSTHTDQFVDAIKTTSTPCSYCRRTHTRHEVYPAKGTFYKKCGKRNHWGQVCRSKQQSQKMSTSHHIHQQQTTTQKRTQRDEVLTHISVQLPTLPLNTACMRVKVDTGAQGNVLPLRVFSSMFPEYMDNNIPQVSVL